MDPAAGRRRRPRTLLRSAGLALLLVLLTPAGCSSVPAPPPRPAPVGVAVWGSSSAHRLVADGALSEVLGVDVYDGGVEGEQTPTIAARQGGSPAVLRVGGGVIPPEGSVAVNNTTFGPQEGLTLPGTLAGVPGTLRSTGSGYRFERRAPGTQVPVPGPEPLVSDASTGHSGDITLLWMGKNDVSALRWRQAAEKTAASFSFAQERSGRVLVLGHFADSDMVPGSRARVAFDDLEQAYVTDFGQSYVDVQSYVRSPDIWADTSVEPTSEDLEAQRLGTLPPSLDDGQGRHLSTAGYRAVAEHVLQPRLHALGWID